MNHRDKCPFCGHIKAVLVADFVSEARHVECDSCGASGPQRETEDEAWLSWRKRPLDPVRVNFAKEEALQRILMTSCPECKHFEQIKTLKTGIGENREGIVTAWISYQCSACNTQVNLWDYEGSMSRPVILQRGTVKRDNWSNNEVLRMLGDRVMAPRGEYDEVEINTHNLAVQECMEIFHDFLIPEEDFGAMGYDMETEMRVHIGNIPPKQKIIVDET